MQLLPEDLSLLSATAAEKRVLFQTCPPPPPLLSFLSSMLQIKKHQQAQTIMTEDIKMCFVIVFKHKTVEGKVYLEFA